MLPSDHLITQSIRNGTMSYSVLVPILNRIAEVLERIKPSDFKVPDFSKNNAFLWSVENQGLIPIKHVNSVNIELLKGINQSRDILLSNTQRFASNLPANNALLWGARGMGKSSLIKAIHDTVSKENKGLVLVEIHREDISSITRLLKILREANHFQFIIFCDDLSFDIHDHTYKSLKAVLEGGIEGRPKNVLFYATSNRRHLMPREMIENEQETAISPSESVDEIVSLSDRFGLWLGFHNCTQEIFFEMVEGYAEFFEIQMNSEHLRKKALEWSMARGARSGRVAWQFIQDLAGQLGKQVNY